MIAAVYASAICLLLMLCVVALHRVMPLPERSVGRVVDLIAFVFVAGVQVVNVLVYGLPWWCAVGWVAAGAVIALVYRHTIAWLVERAVDRWRS